MKKSILASSIAAAVFSLGATGVAQAANEGNLLFVPYYSTQGDNVTLLSLVNTDTANGKAVKVRFRGAANSDDVFDFQVFLSPGDVWTANVSKGATGASKMTTTDKSCTKPDSATLNSTAFLTNRLDTTLTGDALMNGTREGYVEIFNMADIALNTTSGSLYSAIKHSKGVATCSGTGFDAINTAGTTTGLSAPTGGLMANWTIINTVGAAAWSGEATTFSFVGTTKVNYFPQTGGAPTAALNTITADPLFLSGSDVTIDSAGPSTATTAAILPGNYDFPDMSTPPVTGTTPVAWVQSLSAALAVGGVTNEYLTDSAVGATTDWVFSMPTRRYAVALTYGTTAARRFTVGNTTLFNATNTIVTGRQICVKDISFNVWDREENTAVSGVVISPSTPTTEVLCGEASVLSFNNGTATTSGSLKASVSLKNIEVGYNSGWAKMTIPGNGLPILGGSFVRALGNGTQTFGAVYTHR